MKSILKMMTLFVIALGISGCADKVSQGDLCSLSSIFYFEDEQELNSTPNRPLRFIVSHNEVYYSVCVESK